jgi:4-hydroxy-2-oxoheptanedioate aldolase
MKENEYGIWRIIPSPTLTEIVCQSQFDFQIFDCEHGAYDYQTLLEDIRICHYNKCQAYVRVSGLNKVEVQRCLDFGADGIVFPQLEEFEDFELASQLLKFSPNGVRGYNPFVRSGGYGFSKIDVKKIKCIVIIETIGAVKLLDRILSIESIDVVYVGVFDLSSQLGCQGDLKSEKLNQMVEEIINKVRRARKVVALMNVDPIRTNDYRKMGVSSFVQGVDSYLIKSALNAMNGTSKV